MRKRETRKVSQDCSPLPASLLPRKGCTGGQLHVAASQGPAQLLPEAPCPGQRSPLASSAPQPLSAGARGYAPLKIAPPRSLLILVVVLLFYKHYTEKCLVFPKSPHTHFSSCCRELLSFPELLTLFSRPDLKTQLSKQKPKEWIKILFFFFFHYRHVFLCLLPLFLSVWVHLAWDRQYYELACCISSPFLVVFPAP